MLELGVEISETVLPRCLAFSVVNVNIGLILDVLNTWHALLWVYGSVWIFSGFVASSNLIDLRCIESVSIWQLLCREPGIPDFLQVFMTISDVKKFTLLLIYQIGLHRVNVMQLSACIYSIGIRLIRLEEPIVKWLVQF